MGDDGLGGEDERTAPLWDVGRLTQLEANIDDMTAEHLATSIGVLLDAGALDAWIVPIVMKKGRPAHSLCCMVPGGAASERRVLGALFRNTTTLGVRVRRDVDRAALRRRFVDVRLPPRHWDDNSREGRVAVKVRSFADGTVLGLKAEFDHCRAISEGDGVPIGMVSGEVERRAWEMIRSGDG